VATAYEAVYEGGVIRLAEDVRLPEHTRVYVLVPDGERRVRRVASPRLAHPEQAGDFVMQVSEGAVDISF
jgi:predicted DNA-binding antitoxin AbrB/MazE fold protein